MDLCRGAPSSDLSYLFPFATDKQVILAKNCALAEFCVAQVFGLVVSVLFISVSLLWSAVAQLIS